MTDCPCPHCGSDRKRSIGRSKTGKRRYQCRDCRKTWTSAEPVRPRPSDAQPRLVHPGCAALSRRHSLTPDGRRRWFCPDCGKTWTEQPREHRGPGRKPRKCRRQYRAEYSARNREKIAAWAKAFNERRKRLFALRAELAGDSRDS